MDPMAATAANFARTLVFVPLVLAGTYQSVHLTERGVLLAIASGAVTSGIGYVIWYAALQQLKTIPAALVQLSVPAIAAVGGVWLLNESLSQRLLISAALILGGISLALLRKPRRKLRCRW